MQRIAVTEDPTDPSAQATADALAQALGASVAPAARGHDADLLVLGSRPEAGQGQVALSAAALSLVEEDAGAVLVVPRGVALSFGGGRVGRCVIAPIQRVWSAATGGSFSQPTPARRVATRRATGDADEGSARWLFVLRPPSAGSQYPMWVQEKGPGAVANLEAPWRHRHLTPTMLWVGCSGSAARSSTSASCSTSSRCWSSAAAPWRATRSCCGWWPRMASTSPRWRSSPRPSRPASCRRSTPG